MRKVCDIFARPDLRWNFQGASEEPAASGGIHEQIRLALAEPGRLRQRFIREPEAFTADSLYLCPGSHPLDPQFVRPVIKQTVERGPWRVIRVWGGSRASERFEAKLNLFVNTEGKSNAGF